MDELEKQTPVRQSLCGSLRRDGHWKCLCLTLLISGCLAAISWCHFTLAANRSTLSYRHSLTLSDSGRHGPCKEGYIYIPVAFVVMLYLVYLVECWHSHARLELRYKCDIGTVYSSINSLQEALPVIWWKATCYHYVRRTRQVMRYRNGDAFTSTQVYYERVDSSTAGAAFNFTRCGVKDISRPLVELEKYAAIKIKVSKGFSFANLDTEMEFEEQRAQFFQEYETRDDYMEGREGMDMVNTDFKEYMIAFKDPNNLPWYVSHAMYWAASVLLLSWPLRVVIEYKTAHLHYHIHKLFGSNYLEGEGHAMEAGPLSRVSTMNSAELEMSIRNNNVIVPSYSEAVLCGDDDGDDEDDSSSLLQRQRTGYGAIKKGAASGKLCRSLTTATLAVRSSLAGATGGDGSSSRRASNTPAVTMNRVKRFRSCGTFAKADSIEEAPGPGTVRQQVQQLLRDRGRLQRNKGRSSYSMSGLSLSNGRAARFSVGTPGTPDDRVISPTFSTYSTISCRPGSGQGDVDPTSSNDNSVRSDFYRSNRGSRGYVRPHSVALDSSVHRIATNNDIAARSDEVVTGRSVSSSGDVYLSGDNSSRTVEIGRDSRRRRNAPLPFSRENSVNFERVVAQVVPSPTSPASPPQYENAIMMKPISSSSRTENNGTAAPSDRTSAIRLSGAPRRDLRRSNGRLFNSPVPMDDSSPIERPRSETSVHIATAAARLPSQHALSSNLSPTFQAYHFIPQQYQPQPQHTIHEAQQSHDHQYLPHQKQDKQQENQQTHDQQKHHQKQKQKLRHQQEQQEQQQITPTPVATLKALPKVSSTVCAESDDSDSECLHSSRPETGRLQNVPFGNEYLSRGARLPRSAEPRGSIAQSAGPLDGPMSSQSPVLPPHLREGSIPSTAVSTTAASLASSGRPGAGAGHQETPV